MNPSKTTPLKYCIECGKQQRSYSKGKSWKTENKCYDCSVFDPIIKMHIDEHDVNQVRHKFNPLDIYSHILAARMVARGEIE